MQIIFQILWFSNEPEIGYLFEQAGTQVQAYESGGWIASAPRHERKQLLKENPDIAKDWDETYGDRMIKLVFIGKNMNKSEIIEKLDTSPILDAISLYELIKRPEVTIDKLKKYKKIKITT